jgi:hypothetical protein
MSDLDLSEMEINYLFSPLAIRARAKDIFNFTQEGKGSFVYHEDKFASTVKLVLGIIKQNYPDGNIPFHSRWGHFRAGGVNRVQQLDLQLKNLDPIEKARVKLDLAVTSVLLDAGAGPIWSFTEGAQAYSRSEGLGVASYHMFLSGIMSADKKSLRAESAGLKKITAEDLRKAFQVNDSNPLLAVGGRVKLLNNLATALDNPIYFEKGRPGNILDYLLKKYGSSIPATAILRAVIDGFGGIWPGRLTSRGVNLGDIWRHSKLSSVTVDSLVPFHKLSQWMTYSLIEPIQEAGFEVTGVEELTGLAEYRNGGLMLDGELITLRKAKDAQAPWKPDSDLIIEWRALTVYLLDRIGSEVQVVLGKNAQEFPLAKVLEGGTWWAGRFLAKEKRKDGSPPLQIISDGTVF